MGDKWHVSECICHCIGPPTNLDTVTVFTLNLSRSGRDLLSEWEGACTKKYLDSLWNMSSDHYFNRVLLLCFHCCARFVDAPSGTHSLTFPHFIPRLLRLPASLAPMVLDDNVPSYSNMTLSLSKEDSSSSSSSIDESSSWWSCNSPCSSTTSQSAVNGSCGVNLYLASDKIVNGVTFLSTYSVITLYIGVVYSIARLMRYIFQRFVVMLLLLFAVTLCHEQWRLTSELLYYIQTMTIATRGKWYQMNSLIRMIWLNCVTGSR